MKIFIINTSRMDFYGTAVEIFLPYLGPYLGRLQDKSFFFFFIHTEAFNIYALEKLSTDV